MSPSIRPKNTGKNTATKGVGSMLPYVGSGSISTSSWNGRKSRGFWSTTGAPTSGAAGSSSTVISGPIRSRSASPSAGRSGAGTHPSRTNAVRVEAASPTASRREMASCAVASISGSTSAAAAAWAFLSDSTSSSSAGSASSRTRILGRASTAVARS